MATTSRQENSREQAARGATEPQSRTTGRIDEAPRRDGGTFAPHERARGIETGHDVATGSNAGSPRRQQGVGRSLGYSPMLDPGGSPFALMSRMMDDMDRLFTDFGLGNAPAASIIAGPATRTGRERPSTAREGRPDRAVARGSWQPQMEVFTRGSELVARADLPGLRREDISVEIQDDHLVIQGERRSDREERGDGFFHSERSYGSFLRSIPLPEGTDGDSIQARFADGVLEVTVPLPKQEERRKRVEIR